MADPKLYRACIIERIPVLGPSVARKAGASVDSSVKKRITRNESRSLRPKSEGPSIPNVILECCYQTTFAPLIVRLMMTHGRILAFIEHQTVNALR